MQEFPENYDKGDEKYIKRVFRKQPINWDFVVGALHAGCSGAEIAGKLKIHVDTLYAACKVFQGRLWSEFSAEKKAEGEALLRMKMYQMAMNGDRTMLIFLGKTRLGMAEHHKIEVTQIPSIEWTTLPAAPIISLDELNEKAISAKENNTDTETN